MYYWPKQNPKAQQGVKIRTTASKGLSCFSSRISSDPGTLSNVRGEKRSPAGTKIPSMTSEDMQYPTVTQVPTMTSVETSRVQQKSRYTLPCQGSTLESFLNFRVPLQS